MRRIFQFTTPTLLLSSFVLCMTTASEAIAVAPITPSGLNTQLSQNGQTFNITGGTRPGGGTNLFHSFGDFNVPNHNIANFVNDSGLATSNILGRVTGGNISNIFGTIQTTGFGNANLFLMNPAGFLFGPNATVNVGGMVSFTSADYLRLTDGKFFNAVPNVAADALLSTAPVTAYGFLGSSPGAISIQGSQLSVTPGQSISLVGGNITIQSGKLDNGTVQAATLSAKSGQINLASVASPGEVLAGNMAQAANINGQSFTNLGAIQITEQSVIDVSGNGGGTVLIRGGQFFLDKSTISSNVTGPGPMVNGAESIGQGIDIQVSQNAVIQNAAVLETNILGDATPGVQYGGVRVKADQIQIIGSTDMDNFPFTGIRSDISAGSTGGNSGNILLEATSILIQDLGTFTTTLEAITMGAGNSGNIILRANGTLQIDGAFIDAESDFASGNSGNIELTSRTGNILLTNGPFITSQTLQSTGNAGNITVDAANGDIQLIGAGPLFGELFTAIRGSGGSGGSGRINISGHNLTILDSGIEGDNFTSMPPGSITVNLSGTLTLGGSPLNSFIRTTSRGVAPASDVNITAHDLFLADGSLLSTETFASGAGGHLNVSAQNIQLTSGSQLRSGSTVDPFPPRGQPPGIPTGQGGTIDIQGFTGPATSVLIDGANSGIFSSTAGTAAAGNTNITAQSVILQNGGTISAATSGTAASATGGTITINANQVQVNSGGLITAATSGAGAGGSVNINAGNAFSSNAGSVSSTTTQAANGGNINIAAGNSVVLSNGASVSASSTGQGSAGDIHINAGNFTATNSSVTTEALHSSGGIIKITTGSGGNVQLTDSTISASVLDGSGGGGSVNIDPQAVILENSQILANAVFGPGGNINITTNLLLPDTASVISASSQFGQQGNIFIQSPISPASGKIVPLSQRPLIATTLLSQRCAALAGGSVSSFTVAGRDSLPAEPGGWVSSPLALTGTAASEGIQASGDSGTEDANEAPVVSVRRIAPAGFLTQSFAGSTDCAS